MILQVLGCSGGVGAGLRTTSLLLDDDILIDAGTGVGDLTVEAMGRIRHIFLTHSHLDHIASIPLLLDTVFDGVKEPVVVHGQPQTLQALQEHIFNGVIWPDFTRLPSPAEPVLRLEPMVAGQRIALGGRTLQMVAVNHIVPTVGYLIESDTGVVAFSGDTTTNDSFWEAINDRPRLDLLIVEVAFGDGDIELCRKARHYCPSLLASDIRKMRHRPKVYITHNKPGSEAQIFAQCQAQIDGHHVHRLVGGERFTI